MATQKVHIKEKKIWAVEVVFFLDMNDVKLRIQSHREILGSVKTVHFSTFFSEKYSPEKPADSRFFIEFFSFSIW